jgi:hypothetical protein
MDNAALVTADFAASAKLLEALDDADLAISVALWLNSPDYEDWRLVLSSRRLDTAADPRTAYGLVHDALERAGFLLEHTPPLLILRMTDPFIKALRQIFGKARSVEGMRLGGQTIGDRFVQDAVVYRIR